MIRFQVRLFFLLCLFAAALPLTAQTSKAVQDSFDNRVVLLSQLSQGGYNEQGAIEAASFRDFLKRHKLAINPKALSLLSNIYKANNDDRSATLMLAEAEIDARRDPNPATKAALLRSLVTECRRWELPDQALTCQQLLTVANDSLAVRKQREESMGIRNQLDSLVALQQKQQLEQQNYVRLEKNKAWLFAGAMALAFLMLLVANYRNTDRWRKILSKKELEWELLRGNIQHEAQNKADSQVIEATQAAVENHKNVADPYTVYTGPKPEQIALLIEPNRQVVLYLKSLLADRFQIETAQTANEGLQLAHDLLPDLVVCDTILNGKTGIDVARQIKLSERTNHIPIVLLTDRFGNEGKLDALRAGAEAWFTRPVIDDEFDASIQRLLNARKIKHSEFSRFLHLFFTDARIKLEDPFLNRSVEMIEHNLADPDFMADDIARKMQMSKTHYAKKLRVLTGKEPVQLIREMRLEKAKVLLEKRAGTPQAISELVGFNNTGTFALAFKEYFGENTLLLYTPPSRLS